MLERRISTRRGRAVTLVLLVCLVLALGACGTLQVGVEETPTAPATDVAQATSTAPADDTATAVATSTEVAPTDAAPTDVAPTETVPTEPAATETAAPPTDTATALPTETTAPPATVAPSASPFPAPGSALAFDNRQTAFGVLASYYNAINRGEFERAYGYLREPQQSYESFAAGFEETAGALVAVHAPYFGDAGAGNRWAAMPMLLLAAQEDGSRELYAGCAVAWSSAVEGEGPPPGEWWLDRFTVDVAAGPLEADMLREQCTEQEYEQAERPFDLRDGPLNLLGSYYNAINRGEYERAYGYWETPPEPYEAFAEGFAQTENVYLVAGLPYHTDAAAGSVFAQVPVLLLAQETDGTQQTYAGCFVARRANPDAAGAETEWALREATIGERVGAGVEVLLDACEAP